jgi:hypothetical protein
MKFPRIVICHALSFFISLSVSEKMHAAVRDTTEPWVDSVIAEGVRKIREADAQQTVSHQLPQKTFNGANYGSSYIVIDAANWIPDLSANVFYYERDENNTYAFSGAPAIQDSVERYNWLYHQRPDYVPYYNIVIKNFPFPLEKDVSTVHANEGQTMFAQLQGLGAIKTDAYGEALSKFYQIVETIAFNARVYNPNKPIVCYGCANMLGQFGNATQYRASYCAQMISGDGLDTSLAWVRQLFRIPKLLANPGTVLSAPTIAEKNFTVSLAVRNFIMCNEYEICVADPNMFTNQYARWLYSRLTGNSNIDQAKLLRTCMSLNQLSREMAWSVLTADYENTYTQFNTQALTINYYSNNTLDTIAGLTGSIIRAADQLKNNASITRDSALYYGRLLYRIPSYITGIGCHQRIKLMKVITSQVCNDITGTTSASDYANHCERVCKALYTYLPESDIRPFMDELKSSGVIWDVSYKLDNQFLGFFGNDNYTDFIFTISSYWKKAYPELATGSSGCTLIKWSSEFFNNNSLIQLQKPQNQILIQQQKRVGWQYFGINYTDTVFLADIYSPVMVHVNDGSFIPDLPGIKDLVVPAIFMDWLSHKKTLDDAATTVHVTLAVAALVTGVGEFFEAASVTMRIISAVEVAVSASDLILFNQQVRLAIINQFPTPAEGEQFLVAYERITMAVNLCVAAKGLLTHLDADIANYVSKFDEEEAGLKAVLGENSAEYKGMRKLREEVGTSQAHVTAQMAAQETFDINVVGPQLATQPNTAFFWSGRTNNVGGQTVALEIARARGGTTLEGIIEDKNIWMPEWKDDQVPWELVSAAYAQQVSGEVRAVIGAQLRPGNIWETVELPRLMANPNVTKITTIDPLTHQETIIFTR